MQRAAHVIQRIAYMGIPRLIENDSTNLRLDHIDGRHHTKKSGRNYRSQSFSIHDDDASLGAGEFLRKIDQKPSISPEYNGSKLECHSLKPKTSCLPEKSEQILQSARCLTLLAICPPGRILQAFADSRLPGLASSDTERLGNKEFTT
jgi:hypothetical protein